jgi:hypothetical protein
VGELTWVETRDVAFEDIAWACPAAADRSSAAVAAATVKRWGRWVWVWIGRTADAPKAGKHEV